MHCGPRRPPRIRADGDEVNSVQGWVDPDVPRNPSMFTTGTGTTATSETVIVLFWVGTKVVDIRASEPKP